MISSIFHTILYKPLLNALVLLTSVLPGADIGLAVVALTLIVKFILLPLTHKQITTQRKMKLIEGDLKGLREKHKGNKEEETKATSGKIREKMGKRLSALSKQTRQQQVQNAVFEQKMLQRELESLQRGFSKALKKAGKK